MTAKQLREKALKALAEARKINDACKDGEHLTAEQKQAYDRAMAEHTETMESVKRAEDLEKEERAMAQVEPMPRGMLDTPGKPDVRTEETIQRAMVSKFLKRDKLSAEELRGMTAGSDVDGGYLVTPMFLMKEILKAVDENLRFRTFCDVVQLTESASLGQPTLDTDLADCEWTTETKEAAEDSIKIGRREMKPNPMRKLVKISNKLIRLTPDVTKLVVDRLAYIIAKTQEKAYIAGTGVGQPLGIFTASAAGIPTSCDVNLGAISAVGYEGLVDVKFGIADAYQDGAAWAMNNAYLRTIAKIKDGDGRYVFLPAVTAGAHDTLLGKPVILSSAAPSATTNGSYAFVYGNFKKGYRIVDAMNMAIKVLDQVYQTTGQVGYLAEYEGDGAPIMPSAFKRGKISA